MEKTYGREGKILRVNLFSGEIQILTTTELAERFVGGRGFATKIYWDEVNPKINALDPESPLIIMTGPLAGTPAIGGSRWFVSGKSPLLYPDQFGLGNIGGSMGAEIKSAGFDGIIITGKASKPACICINDGTVTIEDATGLWGLETFDALKRLRAGYGEKFQAVCIGPAGEKVVRFAIAMSDRGACGGSGFGAVMGSKNLKAIVARGTGAGAVARPDELKEINSYIHSVVQGRTLMDPMNVGIELVKRTPCPACPTGCIRGIYKHVSGKQEVRKGCQASYMYTLWDRKYHGGDATPNVFLATSLCNRYGLCTQEMGNLLGWLDKCREQGVLTDEGTELALSEMGSLEFIKTLVDKIVNRDGLGDILAEGTVRAAYHTGKGAEQLSREVVSRNGLDAHAYNPRYFITNAIFHATESTSPMNQLHEVCFPLARWVMWYVSDGAMSPFSTEVIQKIAQKFWESEKAVDFFTYDGKAKVAYIVQNREYAKENLVVCDRLYPIIAATEAEDYIGDPAIESRLLSAVTGIDYDEKSYYQVGERVFNLQRAIQGREGRVGRKDDILNDFNFKEGIEKDVSFFGFFNPEFMLPGPGGKIITRKGAVVEQDKFEKMMDEYYSIRGWDVKTGLQKREKLEALNLSDIIPDLQKRGLVI